MPAVEEPRASLRPLAPLAKALQKDDMRRLGLRRTRAIARASNRRGHRAIRLRLYEQRFDELLESGGGSPPRPIEISDGFAIDESRSLGAAASRRVADALGYGSRGVPYRLTDDAVYSVVDESEVQRFSVAAGTVLFIESSACFHFGSRRPAEPRYQLQYAFVSPVRSDFLTLWRTQRVYPVAASDSQLRRAVLDRSFQKLPSQP